MLLVDTDVSENYNKVIGSNSNDSIGLLWPIGLEIIWPPMMFFFFQVKFYQLALQGCYLHTNKMKILNEKN